MTAKSAISKEVFAPHDERMLGAVQVKRRTKKKIPFLATGGQGEYLTFICLSVTNKKPSQVSITKVKQFEGSPSFVRRSQWMLDQLRQVNGIDPNRDSPEFDLLFENAFDQWVASTASEKCTFFQILHHTCQRYLADRKPEFINCQSKLLGGNSILHSAADSVSSAVQKASQALNERGERLGRTEEKTADMMNSAQQFAETAHKIKYMGAKEMCWWQQTFADTEISTENDLSGYFIVTRFNVNRGSKTYRSPSAGLLSTADRFDGVLQ
nr:PREDICTED: syntaxin-binding protein 6 isoform X1 [Latimeria chalumnae]|eukprot:XP_006004118.1 PREDICTED: syntaxin-binding protein 6 isoform X1 [Latimeria chalumnae]